MQKIIFVFGAILACVFAFAFGSVDLNSLHNYANQPKPAYITKDNTPTENRITDAGATLGRVLFYDKKLSSTNTISCGSCHLQAFAFGDTARFSIGIGGKLTKRHSMRLVNARFSGEHRFFWDERAADLETQISSPIRDADEMGFSGQNGQPNIDSLLRKLQTTDYYPILFRFAFGDSLVTELRMQRAMAQFVRSMQSFDSKYDAGRALISNDLQDFPNFTASENEGKRLFMTLPTAGGAGCFRCHAPPEFSIDPNSLNNGSIRPEPLSPLVELNNTRAPSIRDLRNPQGKLNGPYMHHGAIKNLHDLLNHYNYLEPDSTNTNLDARLKGPQNDILVSKPEKESIIKFLLTLTGKDIYNNEKWSNPFDNQGNIEVIPLISGLAAPAHPPAFEVWPNPVVQMAQVQVQSGQYLLEVWDAAGHLQFSTQISSSAPLDFSDRVAGQYFVSVTDLRTGARAVRKVVK
jgi:cytochrome c peroxidase